MEKKQRDYKVMYLRIPLKSHEALLWLQKYYTGLESDKPTLPETIAKSVIDYMQILKEDQKKN